MSMTKGGWVTAVEDDAGTTQIMNPQHAYLAAHESISELHQSLQGYDQQVSHVIQHIGTLANVVESLRHHYESVAEENKILSDALEVAEGRLTDVQRVVERYTAVVDPVVASDGFTYERDTIAKYLQDCQAAQNVPISQSQTELTMLLFPNRSLKRLLDLLKDTKPLNVRPPRGGGGEGTAGDSSATAAAVAAALNASGRGAQNGGAPQHAGHKDSAKGNGSAANGERLHPCVRVYGYCNYKESCAYAMYPYDACLSHLKGKCRFRSQCHEPHVDFRGPLNQPSGRGESHSANLL